MSEPKCAACGGSRVNVVSRGDGMFMEACSKCVTQESGANGVGFWLDCGWKPNESSPPGLEPWCVRLIEATGDEIVLRSLEPEQLRQINALIQDPVVKTMTTVISELARAKRELKDLRAKVDRLATPKAVETSGSSPSRVWLARLVRRMRSKAAGLIDL